MASLANTRAELELVERALAEFKANDRIQTWSETILGFDYLVMRWGLDGKTARLLRLDPDFTPQTYW